MQIGQKNFYYLQPLNIEDRLCMEHLCFHNHLNLILSHLDLNQSQNFWYQTHAKNCLFIYFNGF